MEFRQIPLPMPWAFSRQRRDFVVSDCNRYAFEFLEKWPFEIQSHFVCIVGSEGAGKTHLAHLWASRLGAEFVSAGDLFQRWYSISSIDNPQKYFVLDEADSLHDDLLLFYLYNTILEKRAYLLMTAQTLPANWDLKFEDVKSRIATVNIVRIQSPNEVAMHSIIDKMFLQRGITVKHDVIEYISNRIERTYESINYWINQIDITLRSKHSKISIQAVRDVLK